MEGWRRVQKNIGSHRPRDHCEYLVTGKENLKIFMD